MKRFIFLDIDGVCNSEEFLTHRVYLHTPIDPNVTKLLNVLCEETGAKIVISSSWGYSEDTLRRLKEAGLNTDYVIGGTVHLEFGKSYLVRGNSIAKWLDENTTYYDDFEYVIFDDDTDMLLSQIDNFIHTNSQVGITEEDCKRAKDILMRVEERNDRTRLTYYYGNKI